MPVATAFRSGDVDSVELARDLFFFSFKENAINVTFDGYVCVREYLQLEIFVEPAPGLQLLNCRAVNEVKKRFT